MTNKTTTERRPANSPRSEQPTNLPTSYTTSWDLTSGERGWVKTKNRQTARFAEESRRARAGASIRV